MAIGNKNNVLKNYLINDKCFWDIFKKQKKVEHFHENKLFIIYISLKVGTKQSIVSEHLWVWDYCRFYSSLYFCIFYDSILFLIKIENLNFQKPHIWQSLCFMTWKFMFLMIFEYFSRVYKLRNTQFYSGVFIKFDW